MAISPTPIVAFVSDKNPYAKARKERAEKITNPTIFDPRNLVLKHAQIAEKRLNITLTWYTTVHYIWAG